MSTIQSIMTSYASQGVTQDPAKNAIILPKGMTPKDIGLKAIVKHGKTDTNRVNKAMNSLSRKGVTVLKLKVETATGKEYFSGNGHRFALASPKIPKAEQPAAPTTTSSTAAPKPVESQEEIGLEGFEGADFTKAPTFFGSAEISEKCGAEEAKIAAKDRINIESQSNCISRFFSGAGRLLSNIWNCFVGAMRALGNFICCKKSENNSELTDTKPVTNEDIISHKQVNKLHGG